MYITCRKEILYLLTIIDTTIVYNIRRSIKDKNDNNMKIIEKIFALQKYKSIQANFIQTV